MLYGNCSKYGQHAIFTPGKVFTADSRITYVYMLYGNCSKHGQHAIFTPGKVFTADSRITYVCYMVTAVNMVNMQYLHLERFSRLIAV